MPWSDIAKAPQCALAWSFPRVPMVGLAINHASNDLVSLGSANRFATSLRCPGQALWSCALEPTCLVRTSRQPQSSIPIREPDPQTSGVNQTDSSPASHLRVPCLGAEEVLELTG